MDKQDNKPIHIAIVMDGNGRWAKKNNLPRIAGHKAGVDAVRKVVSASIKKGIHILTLFAFSFENWQRPKEETTGLMALFLNLLQREIKKLHKNNIKLKILGDCSGFSAQIQKSILKAEELTKNNTGLLLNIAANYSGQWDICQAVKKIGLQIEEKKISSEEITHELIEQNLITCDLPAPDLFIRTSGERRISNFMLWQLAYTEFYFTDIFWPDFSDSDFDEALASFAGRQRRFGLISEQLE